MDHMEDWLDPDSSPNKMGVEQLRAADALILGRKTYQGPRPSVLAEPGGHDNAELVNPIPK